MTVHACPNYETLLDGINHMRHETWCHCGLTFLKIQMKSEPIPTSSKIIKVSRIEERRKGVTKQSPPRIRLLRSLRPLAMTRIWKAAKISGASVFLCLLLAAAVFAAESSDALDSLSMDEVSMVKGELITLKVYAMTRVSVADPGVADIVDANDNELLLIGKIVGQTALFLWDEQGKRTIIVHVLNEDLNAIKTRIKELLKTVNIYEAKISINAQEGKVVISGEIPEDKQDLFDEVVEKFHDDVIDLSTAETIEDLVQIDMQITELNTTLAKSLGIEWFTGTQTVSGNTITTTSSGSFNPVYSEILPGLKPGAKDYLKTGKFQRTNNSALLAKINALITEGKARILSKPKLVVRSGKEATFLVGGEVPIRTTTSSGTGTTQENVEFKEFGISMSITPTIKKEHIDILMNLEVSDIDASTASTIADTVAFSTRSASTQLYLNDNQTVVLAGLIKHSESTTRTRIPFVSDIPILGLLFRNRANPVPDTDQELVVALTPHILMEQNRFDDTDKNKPTKETISQEEHKTRNFSRRRAAPYYLGVPKEMTGYVHDVQQKISQAIVYPREAQRQGWEGTVKLGMLILKDGTLAFALIKESSGHDIFDELTLHTTKELSPFLAFPSDTDLQELNVTIPVVYSLNTN